MDFVSLKSISNATVFLQVIYIPEMFLEKALKGQRSNLVARREKKKSDGVKETKMKGPNSTEIEHSIKEGRKRLKKDVHGKRI